MKSDFPDFDNPNSKPRFLKVNLSSTFLARTKCIACGKSPDIYYWQPQPVTWQNPASMKIVFDWFKKYIKRMTSDWYRHYQPKYFTLIKDFSFYWTEKSFNPRLHIYRNGNHTKSSAHFVVEYLGCPCGKSVWAFAQTGVQRRPEIRNRKARYKYPQKFESY